MAKWSVALFGHHKPRFELREKKLSKIKQVVAHGYHGEPYYYLASSFTEIGKGYAGTGYHSMTPDIKLAAETEINQVASRHVEIPIGFNNEKLFIYNVLGWEKRAIPGDIVSSRPYKANYPPSAGSLIISVDGLERGQAEALCEPYWDLESYEEYNPMIFIDWYGDMFLKAENASNKKEALQLLETNKLNWYDEYIKEMQERSAYPKTYLKKRRFNIPLEDLSNFGVDVLKMLDVNLVYQPQIFVLRKTHCYDKIREGYIFETDGLNFIKPKDFGEVI